jgi:hypothetical protein
MVQTGKNLNGQSSLYTIANNMEDGDASLCTSVLLHMVLLYVLGILKNFQLKKKEEEERKDKEDESFLSLFTNSRKKTFV